MWCALEPAARRVVVGPRAALGRSACRSREINWLGAGAAGAMACAVAVKLRSAQPPLPARLSLDGEAAARRCSTSRLSASRRARPASSMTATRVLGGGWIRRETARASDAIGAPHALA